MYLVSFCGYGDGFTLSLFGCLIGRLTYYSCCVSVDDLLICVCYAGWYFGLDVSLLFWGHLVLGLKLAVTLRGVYYLFCAWRFDLDLHCLCQIWIWICGRRCSFTYVDVV